MAPRAALDTTVRVWLPMPVLIRVSTSFGLRVLQVERAQDALVVGAPLGRGLVDDDDRARIEDLVEEPVHEGEAVQRILEGLVAQVHRDRLVAVLGIEEDVDPGQPPHGLQDLLEARVLELDGDGARCSGATARAAARAPPARAP
jgi:hypothetical protein